MDSVQKKKTNYREIFKFISTIVSWTIFVLLLICAVLLLYYFVATRIYVAKGAGHEPKFSLYTIISPSMVPNINVYDVVIDIKVKKPEDIKINDVITFSSSMPGVNGGTVTHRVIAISKDSNGEYYYQTKGDNNLVEDSVNVKFENIVGKVVLKIPGLGNLQRFMATKAGWLVLVLIPALYIILSDLIKLIKLKLNGKNNRFANFMNRPLLTFKKRKLLTYTPKEEKIEEVKHYDIPIYIEEDDDDDFDLPSLK